MDHLKEIDVLQVLGIIMDLEKKLEASFAWGLGEYTNSQAEAYELLEGLQLTIKLRFKNLIVMGDSSVIIAHSHK
jgi:ribonuclease HI